MHLSIFRRAIIRLRRNALLCLPALALALTLQTTVVSPALPPAESTSSVVVPPIPSPLVNWNS